MKTLVYLTFSILTTTYASQECEPQSDCQKCIRLPTCAWNLAEKVSENRCISNNSTNINTGKVYNPKSSLLITEDKPIDDKLYFSPQKAKLELRLFEPVFLPISFKVSDSFAPPHLQNLIVRFTRDKPDEVLARIEAVSCPEDPSKFHQTVKLLSYQSAPGCVWDFDDFVRAGSRCFSTKSVISTHNESTVYDPSGSVFIIQNKPVDEEILVSPQKVKVILRPREPLYLNTSFKSPCVMVPPRLENITVDLIPAKSDKILVKIEATSCSKDPSKHHQIINLLPHYCNQSLTLEIQLLCTCPCEHPDHPSYRIQSERCSNHGTYKCGICECDPGSYGTHCECSGAPVNYEACRKYNTTCSNRGICVCGRCLCDIRIDPAERIFGEFCECDNFSCPHHEGKICGGPERGTCQCGVCQCNHKWSGDGCSTFRFLKLNSTL